MRDLPAKEEHDPIEPMERARAFMRRTFGFHEFRPGQQELLEAVFEGSDTLVIMPTGGGKSLCYQVPAFLRGGLSLVISPLGSKPWTSRPWPCTV